MGKYVPWLIIIIAGGLFGWGVAAVTTWWGGIIAFVSMVPFLLLVVAGGDMVDLSHRYPDDNEDEVKRLCDKLSRGKDKDGG